MTVPGVGPITALCYLATIDVTSRRYASGDRSAHCLALLLVEPAAPTSPLPAIRALALFRAGRPNARIDSVIPAGKTTSMRSGVEIHRLLESLE